MRDEFDPNAVGDDGELRVAAELQRLAGAHSFIVLNDLLLEVGSITSQSDHVVVDRLGVLVVETKVRRGATIRGKDNENTWTACYPGRRNYTFQNPLEQNREHENAIIWSLERAKRPIAPDQIDSIVVFVGADLSKLGLKQRNRVRTMCIEDLERFFEERDALISDADGLDGGEVVSLAQTLELLDRSGDPEVQRRHAAHRGYAPEESIGLDGTRAPSQRPLPAPAQRARPPYAGVPNSARRRSWDPALLVGSAPTHAWLPALVVCGFGAAALVLLWAILSGKWLVVIFVLAVAVEILDAAGPRRRRTSRGTHSVSGSRRARSGGASFERRLIGALLQLGVLGALMFFLFGGGLQWMVRSTVGVADAQRPAAQATAPTVSAPAPVGVSLAMAQQRLRETAPDVYAKAANLDSPTVTRDGNVTTYTWEYVEKTKTNAARVSWLELSLDDSGAVVGANGP